MNKLKFMVLSDLHCHPSSEGNPNTNLFTDSLRMPTIDHPIENLIELIEDEELKADILICPGDLANRANRQGLISGWSFIKELSAVFNNAPIFSTIGNHDIDSRNSENSYSFNDVRSISKDFPLPKKYSTKFWGDGFAIIQENQYILLVVNSCFFHTHGDKNIIDHGKLSDAQIEKIEKEISELKDDPRIKMLLVHHHPIQHERVKLGENDFIENGENLMEIITKNNFDLVIHGHKHDPWLRYYLSKNSPKKIPIFSSGSFSATNQKMWGDIGNYVHFFEVHKKDGHLYGKIITFSYLKRKGWVDNDNYFLPKIGFGNKKELSSIAREIEEILMKSDSNMIKLSDLENNIHELEYLTPDEIKSLNEELENSSITINNLGKIPSNKDIVYYYG